MGTSCFRNSSRANAQAQRYPYFSLPAAVYGTSPASSTVRYNNAYNAPSNTVGGATLPIVSQASTAHFGGSPGSHPVLSTNTLTNGAAVPQLHSIGAAPSILSPEQVMATNFQQHNVVPVGSLPTGLTNSGEIMYALKGSPLQNAPTYATTTYLDTTGAYAFR